MKKILIIIFAASLFVLGRNILFPVYTKNNVNYTRDILGRITGSEAVGYTFSKNTPIDYSNQTPVPVDDPTIKFDLNKTRVGDKIGTMTVKNISGYKNNPPDIDHIFIGFQGKVALKGKISELTGTFGGNICMDDLDDESLSKIPRLIGDGRSIWFCFTNPENLKQIFINDENSKNATVLIDNYNINDYPSDVYNTATFISLVK